MIEESLVWSIAGLIVRKIVKSLNEEIILILDFGSQYTQLIARRVREKKVYCEIVPYNTTGNKIAAINPSGIILSGSPSSVYHYAGNMGRPNSWWMIKMISFMEWIPHSMYG